MAKSVVRGKALVAKFRSTPGVRDPEALAAYAGRVKRLRKAGKSMKEAMRLAGAAHKVKGAARSAKGSDREHRTGRDHESQAAKTAARRSAILDAFAEDDPFAEDDDHSPSEEEKYEAKFLREMEKAERSHVHTAILDAGGLQTRADLREEYAGIPNTFKRKDGMPGDEMADYLSTYFPEFGIEDERDLIDFLAA